MELNLFFWNVCGRDLTDLIVIAVARFRLNVLVLAECDTDPDEIIKALFEAGHGQFTASTNPANTDTRIRILTAISGTETTAIFDDPNNHVSIRKIIFPKHKELILVALHSQSKRAWSDDDQLQGILRLASRIRDIEKEHSSRRTIVAGDLNMNPFEKGIVGSEGLHAVMTKELALQNSRVVDSEERHFFYNPMWQFFGDRKPQPSGTYFYPAGGKPISYFWNIFDQILIRPDLVNNVQLVEIIAKIGDVELTSVDGHLLKDIASDHLPVFCQLIFRG